MSQADIEPPGWPLCALCVMRMMCFRRVTAFFLRPAINSSETSTMAHPAPVRGPGRPGDDATGLRALVSLTGQGVRLLPSDVARREIHHTNATATAARMNATGSGAKVETNAKTTAR